LWGESLDPCSQALDLYREGRIEDARNAFESRLTDAEVGSNREEVWRALMGLAWFHEEIGEYRHSIAFSNRSLDIASSMGSPFHMGRSLCCLGMNYADMGLYELALEFYGRARDIGAPDGEVSVVPVWGLALQEMGAIYFRMGDSVHAHTYLEKTYDFANEHNISAGIVVNFCPEMSLIDDLLWSAMHWICCWPQKVKFAVRRRLNWGVCSLKRKN